MNKKRETLFGEDSEEEDASGWGGSGSGGPSDSFKINNNYAQRYDSWRNKEELMKMKARYGTDDLDELEKDSEESSSSEEEEWTPEQEKQFFKTLANLKKKDPKIYDPSTFFFNQSQQEEIPGQSSSSIGSTSAKAANGVNEETAQKSKKKKPPKEKPFLLKDHERTMILEKGGLISSDEEEEGGQSSKKEPESLSYYQELDSIRKGFTQALKEIDSEDEDSDSEKLLLKSKPKSTEEKEKDEEEYRLWLKGELTRLDKDKLSKDEEKELGFLRNYWNDEKLDEGEKFLRDYILNRNYIDPNEEKKDRIPSYNEIVNDEDNDEGPQAGFSDEEKFDEQQEEFEHKYNFRFEEPDPEFIKKFPRTIQDSMRREDERRKKQRESAKDRKKEAKERKREEVQRLKASKRKEIMDKLHQLQEISGDPDLPLEELDIDGDFDPAEYDRRMQKIFDEKYYDEDAADAEKPEFPFDPEIDDEVNWEEWEPTENDEESQPKGPSSKTKSKKADDHVEEENNSTSEGESSSEEEKPTTSVIAKTREQKKQKLMDELIEASLGRKANKKKSVFTEVIEKRKPKFDPKVHKSFDEYFQDYYALDFEDLVGDLPCRFKYRKVVPNDFGLTTDEILKAPDRELNVWASLKKTYQYRQEDEEKFEAQAYRKKAENEKLKKRILMSIYDPTKKNDSDADNDEASDSNNEYGNQTIDKGNEEENPKKKSKKKKKKKKKSKTTTTDETDDVTEVSQNNESVVDANESVNSPSEGTNELEESINDDTEEPKKEKKKKKKKNKSETNGVEVNEESINGSSEVTDELEKPTNEETEEPTITMSKRQRKNLSKKRKEQSENHSSEKQQKQKELPPPPQVSEKREKKSKPQKGLKRKVVEEVKVGVEDDRLKAYGLNPKKFKKWVKYGGGQ